MQDRHGKALDWIAGLAPWGSVLFIEIHVLATVDLRSRIGARAKGEAVFGVAWGLVYGSIASTWGASCAVLVGPRLAWDANARKIDSNQRYTAIDCAVVAEGWKIVGLTGLSPIFPLTLLNYAYGRILAKFSQCVLASWIGLMGEAIDCDFNQMHQDAGVHWPAALPLGGCARAA